MGELGSGDVCAEKVLRFSCLFGTVLGVGSIKARRWRWSSGVWRELLGAVFIMGSTHDHSDGRERGFCMGCDKLIFQSGRGRPKKWCSEACRVRAFREGRSGSEASAAAVRLKVESREALLAATADVVCEVCGGEVRRSAAGHPRKYCSRSCSDKAVRARAVAEGRVCSVDGCGRAAASKGLCGSHYSIEWNRLNPDKRSARAHRYRARKLAAFVEDVGRIEVLERDGWVCHICGESIGKELEFPHRLYGTLDHVVPLNKGGLHCLDNVKAAHWICNSLKRADEAFEVDDVLLGMVLGDLP